MPVSLSKSSITNEMIPPKCGGRSPRSIGDRIEPPDGALAIFFGDGAIDGPDFR
jgi:hypothetical protein